MYTHHMYIFCECNDNFLQQKVVPPRFARLPQNSKNIGKSNLEVR